MSCQEILKLNQEYQDNRPKNISETGGQSDAHIPKPEACDSHT